MDGGYHLNLNGINDFNTLLLWTFIMSVNITFVSTILDSPFTTPGIFTIEFLQRKANNISLMMMSVWNKSIRDIIIKNIGKMLYSTLLCEEITLSNNLNISLIDMSIFLDTLYDMLVDDVIDFDIINYKENNTITHLLFESINPFFKKLRSSNNVFIKLSAYDNHSLINLPENVQNKLINDRFKFNDKNMIPLSSLIYGYEINNGDNNQYIEEYIKLYIKLYNLDDITNITLNNNNPIEILLILEQNNSFSDISSDNIKLYYDYFVNYAWSHLNNQKFRNMITKLAEHLETRYKYLSFFREDFNNDVIDINNITGIEKNQLILAIYLIKNINLIEKDTILIKDYIIFLKNNINNFTKILHILLSQIEQVLFKNSSLETELFDIYFAIQLNMGKFSQNYLQNIDKFYDNIEHRENIAKNIIEQLANHNHLRNISYLKDTIVKYIDYISDIIDIKQFTLIFTHCINLRDYLLQNDKISNNIKFGSSEDTSDQIFTILDLIDENYQYVLPDANQYKHNNSHRLIKCLTNITILEDFKNFCHIFTIDEEFINKYNIKSLYIDNIINKSSNYDNLTFFLETVKYNNNDIFEKTTEINDILNLNTIESKYFVSFLLYLGLISLDYVTKKSFDDLLIPNNIGKYDYYKNIIIHYKNDYIIRKGLIQIFSDELTYDKITTLFTDLDYIIPHITEIIISNKNILLIIKYLSDKNSYFTSQLLSTYNKTFIESNILSISDKINILLNINQLIEDRIPKIIIDNIAKNNLLTDDIIVKYVKLCDLYNQAISDDIIRKHPELIHYTQNKHLIDEIINKALHSYELFQHIIQSDKKSQTIEKKLLKITKEKDISLYIECLINFDVKLTKSDKKLILENINTDNIIFKLILDNSKIKTQLFDSDKIIAYLMDNNSDFLICNLKSEYIMQFIDYYKYSDLTINNKMNIPRIFAFYKDMNPINKLIELFGLEKLENISNRNRNIYDHMIMYGEYDKIPLEYILKDDNIIKIIKTISTQNLGKILEKLNVNDFEKLLNITDNDGNNIVYYLIRYHEKLFKLYVKDTKITHTKFIPNNLNETLLMKLIRDSQQYELEPIIKWIVNNFELNNYDYYVSTSNGSVLTYCMKYNNNLIKIFQKDNIIKLLLCIYDTCDILCPFADNSNEKNILMNILYIACIKNHTLLDIILRSDKRITSKLVKEKLQTTNFEHNILSIALFNNPESVQVILGFINNDTKFIKETDDMIGGFEKVIDVQPASWYYLQQYCNIHNYRLHIDLDSHWYGYNYKQKMTSDNIKKITHYILDKQEICNKNNICNICDTYKSKIVFTKCRHKVCIVCAIRSDKCGSCRNHISDEEKILI